MLGAEFNDRLTRFARDGAPLDAAPAAGDEGLWVALAPPARIEALGERLAGLRAAGHAVQGFVDRAALLAAWLDLPSPLVLIELARQAISISVASRSDGVSSLRRHVLLPGGERALHAAWLELARTTLVQQTRFDPLHDARGESQLRDRLPQLAAVAQQDGQASISVDAGQTELTLTLTRDQLAAAGAPVLAPAAAALAALSAAGGEGVLLVPEALPGIPGIEGALAGARFAGLFTVADGLAARGASLLAPGPAAPGGAVPYRTQLPPLAGAPADALVRLDLSGPDPKQMATHVVFRGRVLPIPAAGLVIGRDPGDGQAVLRLPEGVAGLSRRHCTLRRQGGRSQIIDHSSHGSFLDGARVRGRALLAAGSTLRLGDPGIELPLVAIDG